MTLILNEKGLAKLRSRSDSHLTATIHFYQAISKLDDGRKEFAEAIVKECERLLAIRYEDAADGCV